MRPARFSRSPVRQRLLGRLGLEPEPLGELAEHRADLVRAVAGLLRADLGAS